MKSIRLALFIVAIGVSAHPLFGNSITGPVYPAPGGNNFGTSGVSGTGSGATLTYSNFDPTQYSQLWWGPTSVQDVCIVGAIGCGTNLMTFTG
jgi:hypothetical protein